MKHIYGQRIKRKHMLAYFPLNPQQLKATASAGFSINDKQRFLQALQSQYKRYVYHKNIVLILHRVLYQNHKDDYQINQAFLYKVLNLKEYPDQTIMQIKKACKNHRINEGETAWDLIVKLQTLNTKEKDIIINQVVNDLSNAIKKIKKGLPTGFPKPRKINSSHRFSLTLHKDLYRVETGEVWQETYPNMSFKPNKHYIRLRMDKSCYFIELIDLPIEQLQAISLVWKHGEVYFHFLCNAALESCRQSGNLDSKEIATPSSGNLAGLDIGYCRYFTLALNERAYCQSDNEKINQKLDKLSNKYAKAQSQFSLKGSKKYQKKQYRILRKRESLLKQYKYDLNKQMAGFCRDNHIGSIAYSRNILKSKLYKSKLSRKTNRWFHNVPLGELVNTFIAQNPQIQFHEIDEALSSKIHHSVFKQIYPNAYDLLKQLNQLRQNPNKDKVQYQQLRKAYFAGISFNIVGKRKDRVMRFQGRDMDADVNAAINHINIYLLRLDSKK